MNTLPVFSKLGQRFCPLTLIAYSATEGEVRGPVAAATAEGNLVVQMDALHREFFEVDAAAGTDSAAHFQLSQEVVLGEVPGCADLSGSSGRARLQCSHFLFLGALCMQYCQFERSCQRKRSRLPE